MARSNNYLFILSSVKKFKKTAAYCNSCNTSAQEIKVKLKCTVGSSYLQDQGSTR